MSNGLFMFSSCDECYKRFISNVLMYSSNDEGTQYRRARKRYLGSPVCKVFGTHFGTHKGFGSCVGVQGAFLCAYRIDIDTECIEITLHQLRFFDIEYIKLALPQLRI